MRNIYIATPVDMGNYGNRLQNFAVHRICEKIGFHPITLAVDNKKYGGLVSKHVIMGVLSRLNFEKVASRSARFDSILKSLKAWKFTRRWIETKYVSFDFKSQSIEKDAYVGIGGDQIWSPYWYNIIRFCNFIGIDPEKKICFAPSFGTDDLSKDYEKIIAEELLTIAKPAVREKSGAAIIERTIGCEARVVADPVLSLSEVDWESYAGGADVPLPKSSYIFVYLLGAVSEERKQWIENQAKENCLSIVDLSGKVIGKKTVVDPLGFVKLIINAQYVLTDSYHAILFSLLFSRRLVIFMRDGGEKMNTRIHNVIDYYGIENCWYNTEKTITDYKYDVKSVKNKIGELRNSTYTYYSGIVQEENNAEICYRAYAKNDDIRMASSSGGVFFPLGEAVFRENGYVVGAEFGTNGTVSLQMTNNLEHLRRFCGSKYVQADVGRIYTEVEQKLKTESAVLFTGTPCQCNALHSYLGREYENLFIVDFICHGVPTKGVWQKYYAHLNKGKKVVSVNFRDKRDGWNNFGIGITYEDGTDSFTRKANENYLQFFFRNFSLRPSCYKCRSKGNHRYADITLADYWGQSGDEAEKGYSACIVHTDKGARLLNKAAEELVLTEASMEDILRKNQNYASSVGKPFGRNKFFKTLDKDTSILENYQKYTQISFAEKVVRYGIRKLRIKGIITDKTKAKNYIELLRLSEKVVKIKANCSGCAACYNACLKGAIKMEQDAEGASYPVFDKEMCINCGKCERVCYNPYRD